MFTSPSPTGWAVRVNRKGSSGHRSLLYNIEESDIDTLYKSHLSLLVSSCCLAGRHWEMKLAGRAGTQGHPVVPHLLAVPL